MKSKFGSVWICVVSLGLASMLAHGESESGSWQDAGDLVERNLAMMKAFIANVEFTESDIKSVIELWPEVDKLSEQTRDDRRDDVADFNGALADPAYRAWAARHGVDAELWLRKATRISSLLYRDQMLQGTQMSPEQIRQQEEGLEQQKSFLTDEQYHQAKQALQAATASAARMHEALLSMPAGTATERALLEKYRDQLSAIMMSESEDEPAADDFDEDDSGYVDPEENDPGEDFPDD